MENTNNCTLAGKEIMNDLLMGEKYLSGMYNTYLLECATPEVRQTLCSLLTDTHSAAQQLFEEMNSRGWYPVTKAEEQKLTQTKQQFATTVNK